VTVKIYDVGTDEYREVTERDVRNYYDLNWAYGQIRMAKSLWPEDIQQWLDGLHDQLAEKMSEPDRPTQNDSE